MDWLQPELDWWEMLWFVAVTVALHAAVVALLGGALALVEKYGLFQSCKIQTKVQLYRTEQSTAPPIPYIVSLALGHALRLFSYTSSPVPSPSRAVWERDYYTA